MDSRLTNFSGRALPPRLERHLEQAQVKVNALLLPVLNAAPAFRREANDYTFDVKYYGGEPVAAEIAIAQAAADLEKADAFSLYLHYPLCPYICRFCHYHVRARSSRTLESLHLLNDLYTCSSILVDQLPAARLLPVSSIYLGGGTPSLLSGEELSGLLTAVRGFFRCERVEEITVESTPDTVTQDWLETIQAAGVTRVSSGVQILDDEVLAFMGRRHTTEQVRKFLEGSAAVPGLTTNVDLIAGLPLVSEETWLRTLDELVAHGPESITVYRLRLGRSDERQSSLAHLFERSPELFPTQERVALQILSARSFLLENGYQEGPIGWFWRGAGQPKCYRDRWLLRRPLLGVGESAYSYGEDWQIINNRGLSYKRAIDDHSWPVGVSTSLSGGERTLRKVAWRLRATGEVPSEWIAQEAGLLVSFDHLAVLGLIEQRASTHSLTELGILLIDEVVRCYLHSRAWDRPATPEARATALV